MSRMVFVLVAGIALAGVVASMPPASGQADGEAAPVFGVTIPPGYRDWRFISVAHEAGNLNDSCRFFSQRRSGAEWAGGQLRPARRECHGIRLRRL